MTWQERIDRALKDAGLSIVGASFGKRNDKTTWRVDWAVEPTDEQREAARKVIEDFEFQEGE